MRKQVLFKVAHSEQGMEIRINSDMVRDGYLAQMDGNTLKQLLVILSHSDSAGQAYPNQETIAEIAGLGSATVKRRLKADDPYTVVDPETGELLAVMEIFNNPQINQYGRKSCYVLCPVIREVEGEWKEEDNPEIYNLFARVYSEKYKETLTKNQKESCRRLQKLLDENGIEDAEDFIRYYVGNYEDFEVVNSNKFPRPNPYSLINPAWFEKCLDLYLHGIDLKCKDVKPDKRKKVDYNRNSGHHQREKQWENYDPNEVIVL